MSRKTKPRRFLVVARDATGRPLATDWHATTYAAACARADAFMAEVPGCVAVTITKP